MENYFSIAKFNTQSCKFRGKQKTQFLSKFQVYPRLDMVRFGTVYSNVLFKFCDYQEKKTNKQEKTRKILLCALMNDDLIRENIISYCFLRCYIYVSLLLTRLHMRLNGGMCLPQTSRDTDDVKRRLRPRVNPDLL